jgi:sugar lactone lactonase YvrE
MKRVLSLCPLWFALCCWQTEAQIYDTNNDIVQTLAGSGFSGYVDGVGLLTMFHNPSQIVADSQSNLFVLDVNNSRIRKITPDGTVSTFLGGGNQWPTGSGTSASLIVNQDSSMAIDHSNVLWIATSSGYLVRVGPDAYMAAIFLNGTSLPWGTCADSGNNIYISDFYGNRIYRYSTNGVLAVFAGSGNQGYADGHGIFTAFYQPAALAADSADNIYVWDSANRLIRRIDQSQNVTTLAGKYLNGSNADGVGTNASFGSVSGMCADGSGNVILACGTSIRNMSVTINVTTLAGSFTQNGYANGAGNLAQYSGAIGVCLSGSTIYVADSGNQRIRSITCNPTAQLVLPANLQLNTYPGLQIVGTVGRTYQIQSSPDMTNWTTRAILLLASSPYLWFDQNVVSGNKFYRAWLLP